MKLSVALLFAGLFGALAAISVLLSFGTDYWLLASEICPPTVGPGEEETEPSEGFAVYYHEGFFWKCMLQDNTVDDTNLLLKLWLTTEPKPKECVQGYLFPFPVDREDRNATNYETAIIYRGFWSVFMLVSVVAVVLGGFIIICAAPFACHQLYKAGGGLFLVSGVFLLGVVVMTVLWVQVLDVVDHYVDYQRAAICPDFELSLHYGPSFMLAPVGVFSALLSGLLFLLIGRSIQIHYN